MQGSHFLRCLSISCDCCNASYIGQKRHLKVRMSEHMGVSPLTNKKYHLLMVILQIYFSELAHANSSYILELKESLFILRDNPVLSRTIRSAPLYLYITSFLSYYGNF